MPDVWTAAAHLLTVDDDAVRSERHLRGLVRHVELEQHLAVGVGHGPWVSLILAEVLQCLQVIGRIDVHSVEVDGVGVLRPDVLEAPQLGAADRSSRGEEEEERRFPIFEQTGRRDRCAVGQHYLELRYAVADVVSDLEVYGRRCRGDGGRWRSGLLGATGYGGKCCQTYADR